MARLQPRWSKLQKLVYGIVAPDIGFQLQCRVYGMDSQGGHTGIPRYWITLGREIIWDYPRQFVDRGFLDRYAPYTWPHATDISAISCVIRAYLDTPRDGLLAKAFENDLWGIMDILRAADRRIGSRHWDALERRANSEAVSKVLARRRAGGATERSA